MAREISRDMALAELARCFGEDRVPALVLALASPVWVFSYDVHQENEDDQTVLSFHATEMGATIAAVEFVRDGIQRTGVFEFEELHFGDEERTNAETLAAIARAIETRDLQTMHEVLDAYESLTAAERYADPENVPAFNILLFKRDVKR